MQLTVRGFNTLDIYSVNNINSGMNMLQQNIVRSASMKDKIRNIE